jgi:hypothetical protein
MTTAAFLPADVIKRLAAEGWADLGLDAVPGGNWLHHRFERGATCQHLCISTTSHPGGARWANVEASKTLPGTRKLYEVGPIVHDVYRDALAAARGMKSELAWLASHGIELRYVTEYLLSSGRASWSGHQTVRKTSIFVGGRVAA